MDEHRASMAPPLNRYGTFSHGWREHVEYFPMRFVPEQRGFVSPYEEPSVAAVGTWFPISFFSLLLAIALGAAPLVCAGVAARWLLARAAAASRRLGLPLLLVLLAVLPVVAQSIYFRAAS